MRPVNSKVEFKQIIGRGTRIFEGKNYFTIYDFVKAYHHFNDSEWDGEPLEPEEPGGRGKDGRTTGDPPPPEPPEPPQERLVIKLADGKERQIRFMTATNFFSPDGKLISAAQFIQSLYDTLEVARSPQVGGSPKRDFGPIPKTRIGVVRLSWQMPDSAVTIWQRYKA